MQHLCNFSEYAYTYYLDENDPYPVWHGMSPGPPEVPVDDDNGDEDTHSVHDEREQQVLHPKQKHNSKTIQQS